MKEKLHRIWRGIFGEVKGINLFLLNSLINEEEEEEEETPTPLLVSLANVTL